MAAKKPIVSWLTGSGAGFYEKFLTMGTTLQFEGVPAEVKQNSLLAFVLSRLKNGSVEAETVYKVRVTDISEGHHDDVLNLLLLGLGAVDSEKNIWLAETLVRDAYGKVEADHGKLLEAILGGLHDAMDALPPLQNENLALSRHLAMNKGEVASILAKITAAKAEETAE